MSDPALEPLLQSPIFPRLADEVHRVAIREKEAREQFLKELTPEMKAEFIQGEVFLHSPAKARHLAVTRDLLFALTKYCRETGNGTVFSEKCLISLTRNDFEPDVVWFSREKAAQLEPDQMLFPAPDFVVEVLSQSTEERDRTVKFEDYAVHGVAEYWIVDAEAETVEQYTIDPATDRYQLAEKLAHGSVKSHIIDGFEISWDHLFG
ncbi:MAG: Uma2 family endonuclease [Verrucomicrobiota bacterium]